MCETWWIVARRYWEGPVRKLRMVPHGNPTGVGCEMNSTKPVCRATHVLLALCVCVCVCVCHSISETPDL